jgi:RNA polymerase sigma-70 factor, ECF subfamily
MNITEEKQLIKKILQGDPNAFSLVVARYQRPVHSLIRQIVWCHEDAEELTQDVFIKAFTKLERFRGDSCLSTWLHRIAYNTAISAIRKKKLPYIDFDEVTLAQIPDDDVDKMLDRENDEWLMQQMDNAIGKLAPQERALLSLYYTQGLPVSEVAKITELSPENVKVKLYRLRKKIVYLINTIDHEIRQSTHKKPLQQAKRTFLRV